MTDYVVGKQLPFYDGPHRIDAVNRLSMQPPTNMQAIGALFQKVFRILHKILNNVPDYDSGYFKVTPGNQYYMEHALGIIPTRATVYYSQTKPERSMNYVQHHSFYDVKGAALGGSGLVGLTLFHRCDGMHSYIRSRGTYVHWDHEEAWVRVLLWR